MRISDWSSDVCSSDLPRLRAGVDQPRRVARAQQRRRLRAIAQHQVLQCELQVHQPTLALLEVEAGSVAAVELGSHAPAHRVHVRSEERRVGNGCVSTTSSRWSPFHLTNITNIPSLQYATKSTLT